MREISLPSASAGPHPSFHRKNSPSVAQGKWEFDSEWWCFSMGSIPLFNIAFGCERSQLEKGQHTSSVAQDQRERDIALRSFMSKDSNVMIATDVASRGLDIKGGHVSMNTCVHVHVVYETYLIRTACIHPDLCSVEV